MPRATATATASESASCSAWRHAWRGWATEGEGSQLVRYRWWMDKVVGRGRSIGRAALGGTMGVGPRKGPSLGCIWAGRSLGEPNNVNGRFFVVEVFGRVRDNTQMERSVSSLLSSPLSLLLLLLLFTIVAVCQVE